MSSAVVYAGGCAYGEHASYDKASSPLISSIDETEAKSQDELKLIDEQAAKDTLIEKPVTYN